MPVNVFSFTMRHTVGATLERILSSKGLAFDLLVNKLSTSPRELGELFEDDPD